MFLKLWFVLAADLDSGCHGEGNALVHFVPIVLRPLSLRSYIVPVDDLVKH